MKTKHNISKFVGVNVVLWGGIYTLKYLSKKNISISNLIVHLKLEIEEQTNLMQVKKGNSNDLSGNQWTRKQNNRENQWN